MTNNKITVRETIKQQIKKVHEEKDQIYRTQFKFNKNLNLDIRVKFYIFILNYQG